MSQLTISFVCYKFVFIWLSPFSPGLPMAEPSYLNSKIVKLEDDSDDIYIYLESIFSFREIILEKHIIKICAVRMDRKTLQEDFEIAV